MKLKVSILLNTVPLRTIEMPAPIQDGASSTYAINFSGWDFMNDVREKFDAPKLGRATIGEADLFQIVVEALPDDMA